MSKSKTFIVSIGLLLAMSLLGGCKTARTIKNISWWDNYAYVNYWVGKCSAATCTKGESKVKRCVINEDNSVTCTEEEALTPLLND